MTVKELLYALSELPLDLVVVHAHESGYDEAREAKVERGIYVDMNDGVIRLIDAVNIE